MSFDGALAPLHPKMDFTLWYHGNGMNMGGLPCSLATASPYAFTGCEMLDRIALRLKENQPIVKRHFASVPSDASPDDVRVCVYDEQGDCMMVWSPSSWDDWLPADAEFHWDAILMREHTLDFSKNAAAMKMWIVSPTDGNSAIFEQLLPNYDGKRMTFRVISVSGADISDLFDSDFAPRS